MMDPAVERPAGDLRSSWIGCQVSVELPDGDVLTGVLSDYQIFHSGVWVAVGGQLVPVPPQATVKKI